MRSVYVKRLAYEGACTSILFTCGRYVKGSDWKKTSLKSETMSNDDSSDTGVCYNVLIEKVLRLMMY